MLNVCCGESYLCPFVYLAGFEEQSLAVFPLEPTKSGPTTIAERSLPSVKVGYTKTSEHHCLIYVAIPHVTCDLCKLHYNWTIAHLQKNRFAIWEVAFVPRVSTHNLILLSLWF
jgi:hypothetical protein